MDIGNGLEPPCNSSGPVFPGVRVAASLNTCLSLSLSPGSPLLPAAAASKAPVTLSPVCLCCPSVCTSTSPHTSLSTHRRRRLRRSTRHPPFRPPIPIRLPPTRKTPPVICPIFAKEAVAGLVLRPSLSHDNSRLSYRDRLSSFLGRLDTTRYAS